MNDIKNVNLKLSSELHRELKIYAAAQSQTIEKVVTTAIQNVVNKEVTK